MPIMPETNQPASPVSVDPNRLRLTGGDPNQGTLIGFRCKECGASVFGPAIFCQSCTSTDLEPVDLGAKGILYASQISSGEENDLNIRVYGTKKGLQWWQENPNYLVIKDPAGFQTRLSRGNPDLVCDAAKEYMRTPFGHPEGFIEAFANVYREGFKSIRAQVAGDKAPDADHPTVDDGVVGLAFISTVLESSTSDQKWTKMKS